VHGPPAAFAGYKISRVVLRSLFYLFLLITLYLATLRAYPSNIFGPFCLEFLSPPHRAPLIGHAVAEKAAPARCRAALTITRIHDRPLIALILLRVVILIPYTQPPLH
jgi:hypothetical protein